MSYQRKFTGFAKLAGLSAALATPLTSFAQGCAMCYQSANAAKAAFISGLRSGILILLFPPLAICLSLGVVAYRKRNEFNAGEQPWDDQ